MFDDTYSVVDCAGMVFFCIVFASIQLALFMLPCEVAFSLKISQQSQSSSHFADSVPPTLL